MREKGPWIIKKRRKNIVSTPVFRYQGCFRSGQSAAAAAAARAERDDKEKEKVGKWDTAEPPPLFFPST